MLIKDKRKTLLTLARETIHARLLNKDLPVLSSSTYVLSVLQVAFVTLHKHGALRGCIGYVEAIKQPGK